MLRNALLLALLVVPLAACSSDDSPMRAGGTPGGDNNDTHTCVATIEPATFDYVVDATSLTITAPDGSSSTIPRVGTGTDVYGTWVLTDHSDRTGRLHVLGTMTLSPGRATVSSECSGDGRHITAIVNSTAEITADTIEFFDHGSQELEF